MKPARQSKDFMFNLIAETNDHFSDFSPYVASLNNVGTVVFQATLRSGGTGIFTGNGGPISKVVDTASSVLSSIDSHPDINSCGSSSFYARLKSGGEGVFLIRNGELISLPGINGPLKKIGPLGPTINDAGTVAFRADLQSDAAGIFAGSCDRIVTVAETGSIFSGFQGLPVINNKGSLVFRADLQGGSQGIYLARGASLETIAETGDEYSDLGRFPTINDDETTAFVATSKTRESGIFTSTNGQIQRLVDGVAPFERYRGILINRAGLVAFYATPIGGELGLYCGPDPVANKILSLGDPLLGSIVTKFALNPVSVNEVGQIAIRASLADNRQAILRIDPTQ